VVSGVQRHICRACGCSFRAARRPSRVRATLWQEFVGQRTTVSRLSRRHGRSVNWVRKELRACELPPFAIEPAEIVAVMDCVFFGRSSGYLVVRDPHRKVNVYWSEIKRETLAEYQCARDTLEARGFVIRAVVSDGKPGLKPLFGDLPVQMCQFHQKAIITRYLTHRPKLEAGRELRAIVGELCRADEKSFAAALDAWHVRWASFLKDRTVDLSKRGWHYTHKRLRSAYRSLSRNLPYLFTCQRHPELNIPNTTNSLDGSFSHLKGLLQIHRGMKPDLKRKMILSILQNRHRKK
jgi:hypothetical protein